MLLLQIFLMESGPSLGASTKQLALIVREAFKRLDQEYIITKKDKNGGFDLELGHLLKLWSQHVGLFPSDLSETLNLLRP
jgi:hypothetical protein